MSRPTPQELKEAMEFIAETLVAYTNKLDQVARKPFSMAVQKHLHTMALATQQEVEDAKGEQKK